tara:strand:- start:2 stop:268 length:267 start_codon:yes stop_codon:yes gene_type:complete
MRKAQYHIKKRTTHGGRSYVAPGGFTNFTWQWGKWKTIGSFPLLDNAIANAERVEIGLDEIAIFYRGVKIWDKYDGFLVHPYDGGLKS